MSDEPLPAWCIRRVALPALRGLPVELPKLDPEPENVHSIELARTR